MQMGNSFKYPLLGLAILAAFWVFMAVVLRPNRVDSASPSPESGAPKQKNTTSAAEKAGSASPSGHASAEAPSAVAGAVSAGPSWLGLSFRDQAGDSQGQPHAHPIEVAKVTPGSPAAKAGIQKSDIILGIQGQPATGLEEVEDAISAVSPGSELLLELLRSGQAIQLTLTRGASPKGSTQDLLAQLGASADPPAPNLSKAGAASSQPSTGIFINGRQLTLQQVQELRAIYGAVSPPGRYWYDSRSGLFGLMGREAAGFIRPGHNFGPLPANASNGNTGVFINGREINMAEAAYCQQVFGAVYQGRWWFDGRTGYLGLEGNPMPIANIFVALQQAQRRGQGGDGTYRWRDGSGAVAAGQGNCFMMSVPGANTVATPGCD